MTINRRLPVGNLSPPGDGMVIITQLTQVRKEKNGKNGGYPEVTEVSGCCCTGTHRCMHRIITRADSLARDWR